MIKHNALFMPAACPAGAALDCFPSSGHVTLRNERFLGDGLRAFEKTFIPYSFYPTIERCIMTVVIRGIAFEMDSTDEALIKKLESEIEFIEQMPLEAKLNAVYFLEDDLVNALVSSTVYGAYNYSEDWLIDEFIRYQNRLKLFKDMVLHSNQTMPKYSARYAELETLSLIELVCRRVAQLRAVVGGIQQGIYPVIEPEVMGKIIATNEIQMNAVLEVLTGRIGEGACVEYKKALAEIPLIMAAIIEADQTTKH